jgi:hypothetical protein
MTVPTEPTYGVSTLVAVQTAVLAKIDAAIGGGYVRIRSNLDQLLVTIPLTDPAGTVSAAGVLTLTAAGTDTSPILGTAAYAEITDASNVVILSLPAQAGTVAVSGKIVINALDIVPDSVLTLATITIGP